MFQRCKNLCLISNIQSRYKSILLKTEAKERRNSLFEEEKKRQRSTVGRIEKIEVKYQSSVEDITLIMNKSISTPIDCAKHISEGVSKVSALAMVDGLPWDMNRPLLQSCELKLLNLLSPENKIVNAAFWRTCSFILGAVIDMAFKSDITVHLHSFPIPVIKSGSFIYDAHVDLADWKPTDQEMRALSAQYVKLINKELPIDRIEVSESLALDMFQDNPIKMSQIPEIGNSNNNKITLYRINNHIDISKGPMLGNSSLIGRCTIAAVHKVSEQENLYRFQGVALPKGILLNQYAYGILENRARKLNTTTWSSLFEEDNEEASTEIVDRN
ncbi:39S ribosomal protein L39, mitochondrial [Bombus affinis]|uniref:39S ribosomal protein L39, mitochondrial n=1 Tax=Bombus affinis TaxID=309941 RepID=UPI0021B72D23|nr:39S ribosomal protein L39, mitochondrial [Bombus affinis]XP_050595445.1 39S ribosomal protein L39, mitochondrial [Bombus affinis]XP_050595446.1 39S ribosomal protein L39, mitochondrial [Bombus affinis]